ncbi:tetratricopeptide repeat protein [Marinobacterium arenosum]|uniref:tetratricopeptide repeat protein n=1 Tax=Marinobacterium arenosum TaxID=2862496 RepID=UPI001C98D14B|nr:tetratricopeptide repeat protein [Marinobacterium arenosum]MBY4678987.1 sel1 repeat family protein [Marinobacterium arenosum]
MTKKIVLATAGLIFSLHAASALAAGELGKGTRAFEAGNYAAALDELQPLAKEGNPDAMNMVGQMYEHGWGLKKDIERAKQLYNQGAAQGHLASVNSLRALKNKEYQVELKQVRPDAEAGNASAQNRLGEMYEFGYGVERDAAEALRWYRMAAEQHLIAAQHNLGRCYNFGTGVTQDFAEAERWYLKAAAQGHTDAMFFLGTLYSNNHGGDSSRDTNVIAYAWMHNAAVLGNETASAIERRLTMKLNSSQLQEAEELAQEYKSKYVTPYQ